MAKPQSAAKLQQAGGALQGDPDRQLICKAFYEACVDWCYGRSLGANRSFNDYFFRHLQNQGPRGQQIAGAIQREVPFILQSGAAAGQTAASVAANGSGQAQQLAQRLLNAGAGAARGAGTVAPLTGMGPMGVGNLMLGAMYTGWARFGVQQGFTHFLRGVRAIFYGNSMRPIFADGVYNNRVFEIKGPTDNLSGRQAGDIQRCSSGGPPYVVGTESCGVIHDKGKKTGPAKTCPADPNNLRQGPLP
jgi:hypothetical protein